MITGKRFVFDIDGVVDSMPSGSKVYSDAVPDKKMIERINKLYDAGNYIIFFTARGYVTGMDWRAVTEKQFEVWGLKYHELIFGKPNADYYIDDKMLAMDKIDELIEE